MQMQVDVTILYSPPHRSLLEMTHVPKVPGTLTRARLQHRRRPHRRKDNISWTLYDYYDFRVLNPIGYFGHPFHIYGYWNDIATGEVRSCNND